MNISPVQYNYFNNFRARKPQCRTNFAGEVDDKNTARVLAMLCRINKGYKVANTFDEVSDIMQ